MRSCVSPGTAAAQRLPTDVFSVQESFDVGRKKTLMQGDRLYQWLSHSETILEGIHPLRWEE